MDVAARIEHARSLLADGNDRAAARELVDAAVDCRDPAEARAIHQLAEIGLARAGRFAKGNWKEALRLADLHGATRAS